jgi:hypothetical protein
MRMVLNGRPYAYDDLLPSERIPFDSVQLMEIFHDHGGSGQHGGVATDSGQSQHRMGGMGMGRHQGQGQGQGQGGHRMGGMGGMGGMMSMAHPIHLHGQYFQILSRHLDMAESAHYASVKEGFIEGGWKDTVLVMPGERVKLIKPFQDFKGLFMFHCHNLEHEDLGMMRDFLVE